MNFPDIDMDRMSSSLWPLSSLLLCYCQLFPASVNPFPFLLASSSSPFSPFSVLRQPCLPF